MTLRIRSGPARVIASGEVTGFGGHPLRFDLDLDGVPFSVELTFGSDGGDVHVVAEPVPDGLRFSLRNFDGPDGRGSAVPVLLGELGDELVFLHFRAFRWGRTDDRTVHYTFYAVEKEAVGWQPTA